ncbi:hypothetical protein COW36_22120 [bacterium (Candidatus Blackallbacteria) CG17_big_fil_post_rev_8_21_14_2_50_48_46]|uniref:TolC family protein n=1 Tax=bacterium (Candidatus Blackallbacteria) CG17_big_fil_post_rev_8_21_14_2_50_48_46 TaxID=2014261 RepID=A0A2M7FYA7_9BACT|nr:MAG: hypothetical protein COW64_13550 [bacterium (Candidatus Blackallbacteria) CG18_big_fil_WC_8_21_14_2_50_49_26]PIW14315.1 MAG: hypothetical protein COW36_22120 [bacterium (Candidatus Blackallbacteria) CG17_big_fil_post_rev_8_21_14_2_50_48_46]PIW45584.1 MAG: hypothetical protein COW20_19725 [bacterium (Candidatus Blackallbacteria) CG13_big_fil_rev_8_21_14_2_50_49_14]
MKRLILALSLNLALFSLPLAQVRAQSPLTLQEILNEVHRSHPDLLACKQEIRQFESQIAEAGLLENPRIEAMGEDFLGSASVSDQDYMQFTFSASQNIPLSGRLNAQQAVFKLAQEVQKNQCMLRQRQLDQEVSKHYLEVLLWQENLSQLKEMQVLAEKLLGQTEKLIARGRLNILERTLPSAEAERLGLEIAQSELQLKLSRQTLFSYGTATSETRVGELASLIPLVPPTEKPEQIQARHPLYLVQQLRLDQAKLEVELQKSRSFPDLNLGSALRWHPQSQDLGINLVLAAPLQLFNQNQHGIALAQSQLEQSRLELERLRQNQLRELHQLMARLKQAHQRASAYQKSLLPLTRDHLEKLRVGLDAGKFNVMHVLQAQQQLLKLEQEALNARQEVARLELEFKLWLSS